VGRLPVTGLDTLTQSIQIGKAVLRLPMPRFSGLTIPFGGFSIVLWHTLALGVHQAHVILGLD
jgi:hypothetical protein